MRQRPLAPLITLVVIVVGLFMATLIVGNKPNLGLDLQGGVSVVLKPVVQGKANSNVPKESLEQTKSIIEKRVNAIGVGEPDVTIQGSTIVVQIPGIKDQQRALDLVGKTAELRFRPVLQSTGTLRSKAEQKSDDAKITKLRAELNIPADSTAAAILKEEADARAPAPSDATVTTTPPAAISPTDSTTGSGTGGSRSAKGRRQAPTTTAAVDPVATTTAPAPTTTIDPTPKNSAGVKVFLDSSGEPNPKFRDLVQLEQTRAGEKAGLTKPEDDLKDKPVTLADRSDRIDTKTGKSLGREIYSLGPVFSVVPGKAPYLTGKGIEDASAGVENGEWVVRPVFKEGPEGIDLFNAASAKCFAGDPTICPSKRLAIVLDGRVISAPTIQTASFQRDQIQITGSFDSTSGNDLALSLRYGSLPLTLVPQQVETVSATLGQGALRAGLIAGALGLLLVAAYVFAYYRLLGLVTIGSLLLSSMSLWVIISFFGRVQGLTLTLSGIVGIIVSIGVSIDSSVVYFETLKEDVRGGRTLRTAVDKSFSVAYTTIVKADLSSLIGATILYVLSVGPVRGFAFFLGLATILDLFFAYFFMRPAVAVLGRSKLGHTPARFGIPLDDAGDSASPGDGDPVTVGGGEAVGDPVGDWSADVEGDR